MYTRRDSMNKEVLNLWGNGDFVGNNKDTTYILIDRYERFVDILDVEEFYRLSCNLDDLKIKVSFLMNKGGVELWKMNKGWLETYGQA
jgi:hypothetical protein